jgi:hypothetical protein
LSGRLDEDKIEQLRHWAAGLSDDGNPELRATAKAIVLLIEEIDRLHIDLWNAKAMLGQNQPDAAAETGSEATPDRALVARLRRLRGRTSTPRREL